jgi:FlaA1/EpsC-like NDP-sugar epimerase
VFHAAAFKHVPLMEDHVVEAVENNVLGTWAVLQAAIGCGARKFVLISTDKAVNPTSVMGATKRCAEMLVAEATRGKATTGVVVRFGNVLSSNGSVVPLFERQIARGGPVTVTSREVTRYFMTVPEASRLVLQATAMPDAGGRVSILDMGTPIRIWDLAERLVRLHGLRPGVDIEIIETGLRPGEKLHEELWWSSEDVVRSAHPRISFASVVSSANALDLLETLRRGVEVEDEGRLRAVLEDEVGLVRKTPPEVPDLPALRSADHERKERKPAELGAR